MTLLIVLIVVIEIRNATNRKKSAQREVSEGFGTFFAHLKRRDTAQTQNLEKSGHIAKPWCPVQLGEEIVFRLGDLPWKLDWERPANAEYKNVLAKGNQKSLWPPSRQKMKL